MGSAASKPETKVFTPVTPVDFSASFLSQLENSPESDYSRAQYTEKYIQERVAAELSKLEQETIAKFQQTTESAQWKDDSKSTLSVPLTDDKISKLTNLLQENIKLAQVEITDNVKSARQAVVSCLKDNKGKSLNCWDEIELFRKSVQEL